MPITFRKRTIGIAALLCVAFLALGWKTGWLHRWAGTGSMVGGNIPEHERLLQANPDAVLSTAFELLQKARETGNGDFYARAEELFQDVLSVHPDNVEALNGIASICLSRHQFQKALDWGNRALRQNPRKAYTHGILTDALVELGRYPEAIEAAQTMVNIRPDLGSYSRVSYLRELHGDLPGAIAAMEAALASGAPNRENVNWCRVHLGHLYFLSGDLSSAEQAYRQALHALPGYGHALAGLGRVAAARENFPTAITYYRQAVQGMPIAEYHLALAEVWQAAGMPIRADSQYQAALDILEKELSSGMDVADEIAHLLCRWGRDRQRAVQLAQNAYWRRPTVNIAYILAGALDAAGKYEQAREYARKSLQLQSPYPWFHYQLGVIEHHLGNGESARIHLQKSLEMNANFSPIDAPKACALLEEYSRKTQ